MPYNCKGSLMRQLDSQVGRSRVEHRTHAHSSCPVSGLVLAISIFCRQFLVSSAFGVKHTLVKRGIETCLSEFGRNAARFPRHQHGLALSASQVVSGA